MAYEIQVTVDCADPHALADWWAETLGWQVEPQDEEGAAIRHPDGTGGAPRVLFQLVPEAKSGKNRLHLDVRIGDGDVRAAMAGLTARGAKVQHLGRQGAHTRVILTDPEGNEFFVSQSASPAG
jgi:hypothetical protein